MNHSILMFCVTGLGNIILFLPAYSAIRKRFPNAKYTVALDARWYGDPFSIQQFGSDVEFIRFPSRSSGIINLLKGLKDVRKNKYDIVLMPYTGSSWKLGGFLLMTGAKRTIFFKTGKKFLDRRFSPCLPLLYKEHYIEKNFRQVEVLDVKREIPEKWIRTDRKKVNYLRMKKGNKRWIGIHPGGNKSYFPDRRWPLRYYREVLEQLSMDYGNMNVFVFGDKEDEKDIQWLIKGLMFCEPVVNWPLQEVANYLASMDLFVGNDSGIMNLSVGVGTPTVGIMGPTSPFETGPYGNKHCKLRLYLECSPCWGKIRKCSHDHICLYNLTPDMVLDKIKIFFKDNFFNLNSPLHSV